MLAWALGSAPATEPPPPGVPAPLWTRQTTFAIPFRLDQVATAAGVTVEVELHVSADGGQTWQPASRVRADQKQFIFRAPQDGAYLFFVRTVDRGGRPLTGASPAAELHVIVDTQPPRLELAAQLGASGELSAEWRISDAHLRAEGLKLEYQVPGPEARWQVVAVDPIPVDDARTEYIGRATWWPATPGAELVVRAELVDRAGNRAVAQAPAKRADGGPLADGGSRISAPLGSPAPPPEPGPTETGRWPADRVAQTPLGGAGPEPEEVPGPGAEEAELAERRRAARSRLTSSGLDGEPVPPPPAAEDPSAEPAAEEVAASELPGPDALPPAESEGPAFVDAAAESTSPDASPPRETRGPRDRARATDRPRESTFDLGLLPPGVLPDMVRSRRFELDYEVEEVGQSGIGRVELWGSRDGGDTWSSYGIDEDRQSPLLATVEGEGLYGFRITVSSGNGLGGQPPESGELPDVWVGVDLTRPFARLLSAEPAAEDPPGALEIRWEARDEMLAERAVSLAYAGDPGGPWVPLAEELDNSGRYVWRLENSVPERVYLRLEVRDEAGNLQVVESRDPVAIDRLRPKGRIRQVRPVREAE